jgi:uncharacterized membrane protein
MKKNHWFFLLTALLIVLLFAGLVFVVIPLLSESNQAAIEPEQGVGYTSDAVQAEILEIIDEGEIELGGVVQEYQELKVMILEGDYEGVILEVDYGKNQLRPEGLNLKPGEKIILTVGRNTQNQLFARFQDFVRIRPLLILLAAFVLSSILISGWKGVRGLLGMGISILVIIYYIIPQILSGKDPVLISVTGAFFLLAVTLYLVYGWTLKTHAAVLGTFFSLILTAFLASYFVNLTRLTGFGSEDALFLLQQTAGGINMQGLVLGGMLIGALGVLDDLVITQASVVFELYGLDQEITARNLYFRAMRVGRDHVAATVNTLVLAYAGAALPLFLLFSISGAQLSYLLNLEYVAEEIVRTMVGSLGLIAAVPLTTLLAVLVVMNHGQLGGIGRYLGPLTGEDDHGHTH